MHLVTLVNAVSHVVVLVRCTLMVSMLVDAVIEVMLVNASRVAVRDCFTRLLYSGNSVGECRIAVLWWLVSWRVMLVNTVSHIALLVCCTLVVSTLEDAVHWRSHW